MFLTNVMEMISGTHNVNIELNIGVSALVGVSKRRAQANELRDWYKLHTYSSPHTYNPKTPGVIVGGIKFVKPTQHIVKLNFNIFLNSLPEQSHDMWNIFPL